MLNKASKPSCRFLHLCQLECLLIPMGAVRGARRRARGAPERPQRGGGAVRGLPAFLHRQPGARGRGAAPRRRRSGSGSRRLASRAGGVAAAATAPAPCSPGGPNPSLANTHFLISQILQIRSPDTAQQVVCCRASPEAVVQGSERLAVKTCLGRTHCQVMGLLAEFLSHKG